MKLNNNVNHNKPLNSQVFENSTIPKHQLLLPDSVNATAAAVQAMVVVRAKEDTPSKNNESPEAEVSTKKLSKKVKEFLKDCRLEHLAQKLLDEGERVLNSPSHSIIVNEIVNVLKVEFSRIQVFPFGSRLSGLGSESSDLDLFVDLSKLEQL